MADREDVIKSVSLFSELSKKDLKKLAAAMHERTFPAGSLVTETGKPGLGLFVIVNGTATVSSDGQAIATLKPGDHFGEIALIDDGPRTAEVMADTDLECIALASWQFRPFVQEHPDVAWALLVTLVKRLYRDG
jgi:CRP-like cAMP-binding protein